LSLADDAKAIEGQLARIEGRDARVLTSMHVPPNPPSLSVSIVDTPSVSSPEPITPLSPPGPPVPCPSLP
jgi:hypothetical protein